MLTNYNSRNANRAMVNNAAALAGVIARRAVDQLTSKGVNAISEYLGGRQANLPKSEFRGGSIIGLRATNVRSKASKKKRKIKRRSAGSFDTIPRGPSPCDRITVTLREVLILANTAANVCDTYYQFACNYTAGRDMRTWLPRAGTTLSSGFSYFHVRRIGLSFQSTLAYTSTGYIGLGIDPDVDHAAPGGLAAVARHDPSKFGDVKDSHDLVWVPGDTVQGEDKFTQAASTAEPSRINQAVLQIYSANSELNAVQLGVIAIQAEVTFYGLK